VYFFDAMVSALAKQGVFNNYSASGRAVPSVEGDRKIENP